MLGKNLILAALPGTVFYLTNGGAKLLPLDWGGGGGGILCFFLCVCVWLERLSVTVLGIMAHNAGRKLKQVEMLMFGTSAQFHCTVFLDMT